MRGEAGKIFLVAVENRSAETLRNIIADHFLPGTTIVTDKWKEYKDLDDFGIVHETMNHSKTFKDPITGASTNTVEGLNSGLKRRIPVRNRVRNGIENHLAEYVWRRQNEGRLFEAFIEAIRDVYYELKHENKK